jgi:3D (Asp-Asp-Asp) domain-containing protein
MVATAYCLTGSTATGTTPRIGVAASKPSWFGKTVKVYTNSNGQPGKLIGTYTIEDTGGEPIQTGSVIDIWLQTEDECFQFGRKCVLVEIL